MFGKANREEKRIREAAANCLEWADKVWNNRRDQLSQPQSDELSALSSKLRGLLAAKAGAADLGACVQALEAALRRTGGAVYPRSVLAENVEFLLVVAIVVIGFRSYFVQNFVIPTNSMWPTYNGMTAEVFRRPSDEPGALREAGRMLAAGAWPHRLDAPADGELLLPIGGAASTGFVHCSVVAGRTLLVLPAKEREYSFLVGAEAVRTRVPEDFDLDWAVYDAFLGGRGSYTPRRMAEAIRAKFTAGLYVDRVVDGELLHCVRTGRAARAGERIFAFDEIAGDKVLAERVSYNFVRPKIGSGFVFRTGAIPGIARVHGDEFYIKRLVGLPGDTLEVRGTTLYRNGAPIEGADAFEANSRLLGRYPGYEASGLLAPGRVVHVEPGCYFGLGDNSPNSGDGRAWGFVPAKEVVGRSIAVYYPLVRSGPAR
jgi:signal peptidase I